MKETIKDNYKILNQIGMGSYASVYKAIDTKTKKLVAIKKIRQATTDYTNLMNEINIMSNSNCENIVQFLDSEYLNKELLIVMEYCCGGSVKDVMRQLERTITEDESVVIIRDVLNGLNYLHSNDKIHRDVKAANILLNGEGIAKLGDFGVSEPLKDAKKKQTIIGTPLWLPPEVIRQDQEYSTAIDIWSLGITIIEMADGAPPYQELERNSGVSAAWKEIIDLDKPAPTFKSARCSQELVDFLALCLDKVPAKRKSARELLNIIKRTTSHKVIRKLVEEVCTVGTYKDQCLMRAAQVDLMAARASAIQVELERRQNMDAKIVDMMAQLTRYREENRTLERHRDRLKSMLDATERRKLELVALQQMQRLGKF